MYRIDQNFREVEYLCDTAKVKYAVYNMIIHSGLLKPDSEKKYFEEHNDISDFPDMTKRLDVKGSMAISFAGKVPVEILTSYGAMKIHYGQNNGLVSTSDEAKFWETLQNTFGLEPIQENNFKIMAVTKLPWCENDSSTLEIEKPTTVLEKTEINPQERTHLKNALKVVNAHFIQNHHPEFILHGIDNTCMVNGLVSTLEQALENYPNLIQTMEKVLHEDYLRLHQSVAPESDHVN